MMGLGGVSVSTTALQNSWFIEDINAVLVRMMIDTNGNIGLGTTSTASALVNIGTNSTASNLGVLFGTDTNLYRSGVATLSTQNINPTVDNTYAIGSSTLRWQTLNAGPSGFVSP